MNEWTEDRFRSQGEVFEDCYDQHKRNERRKRKDLSEDRDQIIAVPAHLLRVQNAFLYNSPRVAQLFGRPKLHGKPSQRLSGRPVALTRPKDEVLIQAYCLAAALRQLRRRECLSQVHQHRGCEDPVGVCSGQRIEPSRIRQIASWSLAGSDMGLTLLSDGVLRVRRS